MKEWEITGYGLRNQKRLPLLKVKAITLDEALEIARKKNRGYCTVKIIKKEKSKDV